MNGKKASKGDRSKGAVRRRSVCAVGGRLGPQAVKVRRGRIKSYMNYPEVRMTAYDSESRQRALRERNCDRIKL